MESSASASFTVSRSSLIWCKLPNTNNSFHHFGNKHLTLDGITFFSHFITALWWENWLNVTFLVAFVPHVKRLRQLLYWMWINHSAPLNAFPKPKNGICIKITAGSVTRNISELGIYGIALTFPGSGCVRWWHHRSDFNLDRKHILGRSLHDGNIPPAILPPRRPCLWLNEDINFIPRSLIPLAICEAFYAGRFDGIRFLLLC